MSRLIPSFLSIHSVLSNRTQGAAPAARPFRIVPCIYVVLTLFATVACAHAQNTLVTSFETAADLSNVTTSANTTVTQVTQYATDSSHSLRIDFSRADAYPTVYVAIPASLENMSGSDTLEVDVTNPSDQAQELRIQMVAAGVSAKNFGQYLLPAAVNGVPTKTTIGLPLTAWNCVTSEGLAECSPPVLQNMAGNTFPSNFDLTQVVQLQFYLSTPNTSLSGPITFYVDNVRLQTINQYTVPYRVADVFGQHRNFTPNPVTQYQDLVDRKNAEQSSLASATWPADWDSYHGCTVGSPSCNVASWTPGSWFRVAPKSVGTQKQYWMIDPSGDPMFALGMTGARRKGQQTQTVYSDPLISGRAGMFVTLPDQATFAPYYASVNQYAYDASTCTTSLATTRQVVDFYHANLQAKYGTNETDSTAAWVGTTLDRMKAWRFNMLETPGSDFTNSSVPSHMPYALRASTGPSSGPTGPFTTYIQNGPPDPYDTSFVSNVDTYLAQTVTTTTAADKYLVGYFVDNELAWGAGSTATPSAQYSTIYSIFANTHCGTPYAAKGAMVDILQAEYTQSKPSDPLGAFNDAWGLTGTSQQVTDWGTLKTTPLVISSAPGGQAISDMSNLLTALATKYFQTVKTELKKADPHHLYLGVRFAGTRRAPLEVVQACAQICDVVSFNWYHEKVDPTEWQNSGAAGHPSIISEFHFGSTDTGYWGASLGPVTSDAQRGTHYTNFVASAAAIPDIVGVIWFLYFDDPFTGAAYPGKPEDYHIGFVSVTDDPSTNLVNAATSTNQNIYTTRGFIH